MRRRRRSASTGAKEEDPDGVTPARACASSTEITASSRRPFVRRTRHSNPSEPFPPNGRTSSSSTGASKCPAKVTQWPIGKYRDSVGMSSTIIGGNERSRSARRTTHTSNHPFGSESTQGRWMIATERAALSDYFQHERSKEPGLLFQSREGAAMLRKRRRPISQAVCRDGQRECARGRGGSTCTPISCGTRL